MFCNVDTVASTIQTSVDTTKNVAAAAVDKGTAMVGTAKGSSSFNSCYHKSLFRMFHTVTNMRFYHVDTVASTIQTSVDTTKNVAAAAVDKGTAFVGTAKGILPQMLYLQICYVELYVMIVLTSIILFANRHRS